MGSFCVTGIKFSYSAWLNPRDWYNIVLLLNSYSIVDLDISVVGVDTQNRTRKECFNVGGLEWRYHMALTFWALKRPRGAEASASVIAHLGDSGRVIVFMFSVYLILLLLFFFFEKNRFSF